MKMYNIRVMQGEDGWFVAQATNLRGAITQGRDLDETAFMIRDAIELLTETKDFGIALRLGPETRPKGPRRRSTKSSRELGNRRPVSR